MDGWVEQTDARKHVFEDLGIAAFLLEVWGEAYRSDGIVGENEHQEEEQKEEEKGTGIVSAPQFPGFVDIGCGNGVLVYILRQEGYRGWGFDARRRKTWNTLPPDVRENLKEMLLVPDMLNQNGSTSSHNFTGDGHVPAGGEEETEGAAFHNGIFPPGTFIISNHADELTPWTPLLAHLNHSPFIAIPCCSHNLAGARYRFNNREPSTTTTNNVQPSNNSTSVAHFTSAENGPGPKSGSLASPQTNAAKQPSAYASLTAYVTSLATEVGYEVEKEVLRIPSTRNIAIVGRRHRQGEGEGGDDKRKREAVKILEREVGSVKDVGREWVERARKIAKGKGAGH